MDEALVAHAAVVERALDVGGRALRVGYVEGVATTPTRQGEGLGSLVMRRVAQLLEADFELGALSTGRQAFYQRLGWERWQGPTFVRYGQTVVRTADEDDGIMVLRYGTTSGLDLASSISCERARATTGDTGNRARGSVPAWIRRPSVRTRSSASPATRWERSSVRVARVPFGFGNENWRVTDAADRSYVVKVGPLSSAGKWNSARTSYELAASVGVPLPHLVHFAEHGDHIVRIFEWIDGRSRARHRRRSRLRGETVREPRHRDRHAPLHRARRLQLTARRIGAFVPLVGRLRRLPVGADPRSVRGPWGSRPADGGPSEHCDQ